MDRPSYLRGSFPPFPSLSVSYPLPKIACCLLSLEFQPTVPHIGLDLSIAELAISFFNSPIRRVLFTPSCLGLSSTLLESPFLRSYRLDFWEVPF